MPRYSVGMENRHVLMKIAGGCSFDSMNSCHIAGA
jgi:hypothetical protein